nr:hypothetical protein CFP56_10585 [Quercus suber]
MTNTIKPPPPHRSVNKPMPRRWPRLASSIVAKIGTNAETGELHYGRDGGRDQNGGRDRDQDGGWSRD